jgi:hypothetical protein
VVLFRKQGKIKVTLRAKPQGSVMKGTKRTNWSLVMKRLGWNLMDV